MQQGTPAAPQGVLLARLSSSICLASDLQGQPAVPVSALFSLTFSCAKATQAAVAAAASSADRGSSNRLAFAMQARSAGSLLVLAGWLLSQGKLAHEDPAAAAAAPVAADGDDCSNTNPSAAASAAADTTRLALMLLSRSAVSTGQALAALAACGAVGNANTVSQPDDRKISHYRAGALKGCISGTVFVPVDLPGCALPGEPAVRQYAAAAAAGHAADANRGSCSRDAAAGRQSCCCRDTAAVHW